MEPRKARSAVPRCETDVVDVVVVDVVVITVGPLFAEHRKRAAVKPA